MRRLSALWTPTSRLYDRGDEGQPRRFVLDCGIAWQNYRDAAGVFQEIDLTPEVIPSGLRVSKVPYDLMLLPTGARRIAPDRAFAATKYINFPANKFLTNKTFARVGNSLVWRSNAYDIVLRWENSRIKFDVVLKRNVPFDQVQFDVDKAGIDDATLLSYLTNLKAIDSSIPEPIVRPLSVSLAAGVLTLGFDLTGMTFPVTIDPTLDLQVGASADDCRVLVANTSSPPHTWTTIALNTAAIAIGEAGANYFGMGMRFLNVLLVGTDTIDVAYLTFNPDATRSGTVVRTNFYGEDADNPAEYSTVDDFNARAQTALVAMDGIGTWTLDTPVNTPSIVAPVTTIKDRAGWASGNAMAFMWEDDGSDDEAHRRTDSWDSSSALAPKLHIEYTAGGGGAVPVFEHHYRMQRAA